MSSETTDDTLTNSLNGLGESLREKVLTKFLKLKAAEEATRLQDQQGVTAHSRRKADRYLDLMIPAMSEEEPVGDIIIADDISITGGPETKDTPSVKETSGTVAVPAPPPVVQKTSLVKPLVKYGLATLLGGIGGTGLSMALGMLSPGPPAATSPSTDTDTRLEPYIPTSEEKAKNQ
jgi:hypothetical protein